MARDFWQIDLLGADSGLTVVTETDGGIDSFDFGEHFRGLGGARINLDIGVTSGSGSGLAATAVFQGLDGQNHEVWLLGEIEIARGTYDADEIRGNGLDNRLFGDGGWEDIGGNDTIRGGEGADLVHGMRGDDKLYGEAGRDILGGGYGRDTLNGGAGDDVLNGGRGVDLMTGGAGADLFSFEAGWHSKTSAMDVITDFSVAGGDRINLHAMDGDAATHGRQALHLVDGFSGAAGEVAVRAVTGGLVVEADVTGDGAADFAVLLQGSASLTSADFLW